VKFSAFLNEKYLHEGRIISFNPELPARTAIQHGQAQRSSNQRRISERRKKNTWKTNSGICMELENRPPCAELTLHETSSFNLKFAVIGEPTYLSASFALRYEVYCRERKFLAAENYPFKLERDIYDDCAIHVGSTNDNGVMLGTVRLVLPSGKGFPLFEHCTVFPEFNHLKDIQLQQTAAEVSRLAISKHLRKLNYVFDPGSELSTNVSATNVSQLPVRQHKLDIASAAEIKSDIMLGIYRTIYQASKRKGITHWFAAMEKSLLRLMRRFHFEFIPIGPELDYYGCVTPYVVAITAIEQALYEHCPATYEYFVHGLEPAFLPALSNHLPSRKKPASSATGHSGQLRNLRRAS
jgi:N-acyl amino acid synthase of PEP-CTERM/exosortase system